MNDNNDRKTNKEIWERLTKVEINQENSDKKWDKFMTNDFHEVQADMKQTKRALYIGIGALAVLQFIAPFIVVYLFFGG